MEFWSVLRFIVQGGKIILRLIFLSTEVQLCQTICWKDYPFPVNCFESVKNQLAVFNKLNLELYDSAIPFLDIYTKEF